MQVGTLPVEEVRVRLPDLVQHLDARPQLRDVVLWVERQPLVLPHLTEVAVHRKHLSQSAHYRPDSNGRPTTTELLLLLLLLLLLTLLTTND